MINVKNLKPALGAYLAFWLFGALICIINANFFILSARFSVSLSVISYMISAMSLGRLGTIFISGVIADRIGRKKVILLSLFFLGSFYLLLPFTQSIAVALFLSVLAGMGHGMADAAATAVVFDCFPDSPDFPVSMIQLFFCFGAFSTPIVTGLLLKGGLYFGFLFWGLAVICIITIVLVMSSEFPSYNSARKETAKQEFKHEPNLIKDGLLIGSLVLIYALSTMTLTTWAGTYTFEVMHLSEMESIQVFTFYNIGCMLGTIIIGSLLKRIHPTIFIIVNAFGIAITLLIFVYLKNPAMTYPAFTAAGFFAGIYYSLVLTVVGELFPEKKATASGATMGMSASGAVLAPLITSPIYNRFGINYAFNFMFITLFVLFFITIALKFRYNYLTGNKSNG